MPIEADDRMVMALDEERIAPLAEAVVANRPPQAAAVAAIRERVHEILRDSESLESRHAAAVQALVARFPVLGNAEWPYEQALEASSDALLATLAEDRIEHIEREVLTWPWVSVFGPVDG